MARPAVNGTLMGRVYTASEPPPALGDYRLNAC